MHRTPNIIPTITAFLIALIALCLSILLPKPAPLLVEPQPDLGIPLWLLGISAGLWSARQITRLPHLTDRKWGRWALSIMLPLWLGFGLAALGDRLQERYSFRSGGVSDTVLAKVSEKTVRTGRRAPFYTVTVIGADVQRALDVRVDAATFTQVKPDLCATLLIERAPDGAARLVRPLSWNSRCP
jgi:hypothetical protein